MKSLLISILMATSFTAFAADQTKICEDLYDEAINNCSRIMCEDWVNDDGREATEEAIDECLANSDGDLMEGAQICAVDGEEYQNVIEAYNLKNPTAKVTCEE